MTGRWRGIYSEELCVIFSKCYWDNVTGGRMVWARIGERKKLKGFDVRT